MGELSCDLPCFFFHSVITQGRMQSLGGGKHHNRQCVVYDESGPDLLYHNNIYGPNKDEETPLQRPRPPEAPTPLREPRPPTSQEVKPKKIPLPLKHCWAVSILSGVVTLIGLIALILLLVMHFGKEDEPPIRSAARTQTHQKRLLHLEKENLQIKELYKNVRRELSEVKKHRDKSNEILSCTRKRLQRLRPGILLDVEAACSWSPEEIFLSDESIKGIGNSQVKTKNRTLSPEFASRYKMLEDQFESHLSHQSKFCSQIRDSMSGSLYGRNTEKTQISEALTSANEKMLNVIAGMERAASQEVYKEQDWINAQMKSARNDADEHQNYLQKYLTEKILPQLRVIHSSIADQKHIVEEVSSEMEELFNTQLSKWEKFLLDQKDLNTALFEFLEESESSKKKHLSVLENKEKQRKETNNQLKLEFAKLVSQVESFSQKLTTHASRSNRSVDESLSVIGMIGSESSTMYRSIEEFTESSMQSAQSVIYKGSQDSALIMKKQSYVLESMENTFSTITPASEAISLESKEFVSKFQDDSNQRYGHFERELRKKSEMSSDYLKSFNHNTQDVRSLTLSSQKHLESRLESQQGEDTKITNQLQRDIQGQCNSLKTFGDSYGKKLMELGYSTNQKIMEDLREEGREGLV